MADDNWIDVMVSVLVDANGNAVATHSDDLDALTELYDHEVGEDSNMPRRVVMIKLRVELPQEVELTGEAPLTGNGAKLVAVVKGGGA
jgi:hypothetical protein